MLRVIAVAGLFLWLLVSCAGTAQRHAFVDSTWHGSWNRADAARVAQDFAQSCRGQGWNDSATVFSLGTIVAVDPNLDVQALREELGKAFALQNVSQAPAMRLDATILQEAGVAFVYVVELKVTDPSGMVVWTAQRRLEKEMTP